METNNDIFLTGKTIYLRPLHEEDVEDNYARWLNDPEVTSFNSHGRFPMTKEKLVSYITQSLSLYDRLVLAIIDNSKGVHIGNISLQEINWIDRNAEIAFVLGEKEYWGKGIMFEAGRLLIDHAFKSLNLHRIYCGTSSENIGMQKLAEKLGMRKEGIRKDALFKQGKYNDVFEYGILSNAKSNL